MSNKNKRRDGIVFSTNPDYDYGSNDREQDTPDPAKQLLYVRREVRNGRPVVVVKEFRGRTADLEALGKQLKSHCGVGGTVKDGDIQIQGDFKEKVQAYLHKLGYKTKG
jgi:translation initiation factor 1